MRRAALLLACALSAAGCGSRPVALRADHTLTGHVDTISVRLPTELRALAARRAFLRFPGGRVLETRDAGRRWRAGRWPPPRPRLRRPSGVRLPCSGDARTAAFADAEHGLVICGGVPGTGQQWKEFWSYDRGTWTKVGDGPSYGYVGRLDALGPTTYVHHSGRANDLLTTDGGHTWRSVLPPESNTRGSWITAEGGWALGGNGNVFRTTNGGRTWRYLAPSFWPENDAFFCTPKRGFGLGTPTVSGYSPRPAVYATTDGGLHWSLRSRPRRELSVIGCAGDSVFALADFDALVRSRDGGRTWRTVRAHAQPFSIVGAATYVVACGAALCMTRDGGRTFSRAQRPRDLKALAFISADVGYAVSVTRTGLKSSATTLLRTSDGGQTWRRVPIRLPYFRPATLIGAHGTVWIFGPRCRPGRETCAPTLVRSSDGGHSWDEVRFDRFLETQFEAHFASRTLGVAPGLRGIWITRDGGVTWRWVRRGGYSYR